MSFKTTKQYQDIIEANDGKSFHNLDQARLKNDPGGSKAKVAEEYAKDLTESFMKKVRDHKQPGHEKALQTYLVTHGQDEAKVHAASLERAYQLCDAKPIEWANESYENKILNGFTAHTKDDEAFISKFKDLCRLKIKAEGYTGMDDFIKDFWAQHPLSAQAKAAAPKTIYNLIHPAAMPGFTGNTPNDWRTFDK